MERLTKKHYDGNGYYMRWYSHVDYGKTWLAYRSKPEEDSYND